MLLVPLAAATQESQSSDTDTPLPEIPKFYSESRQILIAATVWDASKTDTSWIPPDVLKQHPSKSVFTIHPPVRGLRATNFHAFDNGIEQSIDYFKEADFPGANLTREWYLTPDTRGTWGILNDNVAVALEVPTATYLIGYSPPVLKPGECRTIRVVVEGYDVRLNREQYCAVKAADSTDDSLRSSKLGTQMRNISASRKKGSINVSVRAFTFWSSGVLSLVRQTPVGADVSAEPTAEYKYVVEVHDAKAPATVQVGVGFPGLGNWACDCPNNPAIHLLGVVYKSSGEPAGEFGNTFPCHKVTKSEFPGLTDSQLQRARVNIPNRFDTQLELAPGEYELHVVISDGKDFGQAYVRLHVEPLDLKSFTMSDLVIAGIVRYSGWVLLEAASLTPAPVIPSPLVSKDSQYFPDSDKEILLHKHTPLYFYFEIYEPQLGTHGKGIYYRWRITDQKSGSVAMNSEPISAADWIVPGSAVVPIGLKVDADKLPKGNYKLEVQASDSAGHESEWRQAGFVIK